MKGDLRVDIIQIPNNDEPIRIITLPIMPCPLFNIIAKEGLVRHEEHLTYVPDLFNETNLESRRIAKKYRELVDLGNMDPKEPNSERFFKHGPYFMYKFSDDMRMVLPGRQNWHFENAEGAETVYGHAFIFKVKDAPTGGEGGPIELESLKKEFINSAFNGAGIAAKESLKWLSKQ